MLLSRIGLLLTAIYFVTVVWISWPDLVNIKELELNELGDYFAGVFGPPALIWVIVSFYLQSKELRASVDALKLQTDEFRASVVQQRDLAESNQKMVTLQNEQWRSDLYLETRKLESDVERLLNALNGLVSKSKQSRLAVLSMRGMTKSSIKEQFEEKISSIEGHVSEVRNAFDSINREEDGRLAKLSVEDLTTVYHMRNSLSAIAEDLRSEIDQDDFQRAQKWQEMQAQRPQPPGSPYGSGTPPRR